MKSITELFENYTDAMLVSVSEELLEGAAPTDGAAYGLLRRINKMIDNGQIKFNNNARHMYMPTVQNMVNRELARRYTLAIEYGMLQADQVNRTVKAEKGQVPGQMSMEVTD